MSHPDRITTRRGVFHSLEPLSRRIPLLMTLVLVLVVGIVLWAGHDLVYRSVITAELTRLSAASKQVTVALQTSTRRLHQTNARIAAMPEVARAISPLATTSDQAAAHRVLAAEREHGPEIRSIALWSANGELVFVEGNRAAAERKPPRLIEGTTADQNADADIGPLSAMADTVVYATYSPVKGPVGETVGYLAVLRRSMSTAASAALLGGLVGKDAKVLIGNVAGDFWTDLVAPIEGPPTPPAVGASGQFRDRRQVDHLFSSTPIPETPWQVLVVTRRDEAVAAARAYVWKMAGIAALLIIAGAGVTWMLVGRSLRPLGDVTTAAAEFAGGDYSRRVEVRGESELARLGGSFNSMAETVQFAAMEIIERAEALEASNERLQHSEQRYRHLVEHSPNGILVHRDRTIVFANEAAARILGVDDADQLVGRSVLDVVDAGDRDAANERAHDVERTGVASATLEMKFARPDKKQVVCEVTSLPIVVDGAAAVQTIMHDVTEKRVLEEQLRQSQKMDAVGRLAGGIAHDFNNILTVIQAHAEFALGDETPEARRADIDEIRRASDSAARLTRQLLTFSRKQVLVPAHIDLNAAIGGMLGMLSRLIGDDIEVVIADGHDLAGIWADPGQLEQVLLNLAINARDAMPDGGVLRFETANVTIGDGYGGVAGSVIPAGDYVMLAVQDTGCGMPEDVRAHVFEPFFTTKAPGRGTGLGLSTVYGIIRQSDAHIWVYSEVDRGTTFKIFFPPHDRSENAAIPRATGEHRIATLSAHVLVVEDEPSVRSAICRALTHARFTVVEAANATDAVVALGSGEPIDLVITDMVMPGKSGAELVADIAISHPDMPVVIMSGYSEETASRQWRVPDNASFIEKPVSPRALVNLVEQLLNGSAA